MSDAEHSTRDTVFIAVTRPPTYYGVPLVGYLAAVSVTWMAYIFSSNHNLIARVLLCGGAAISILTIMRALTSWEPNWFHILKMWAATSGRVRLSRHTRVFGGTTMRPGPVVLHHDQREMRDYRG